MFYESLISLYRNECPVLYSNALSSVVSYDKGKIARGHVYYARTRSVRRASKTDNAAGEEK